MVEATVRAEIIEVDRYYVVGSKSRGYRLSPNWLCRRCVFRQATDPRLIDRIRRECSRMQSERAAGCRSTIASMKTSGSCPLPTRPRTHRLAVAGDLAQPVGADATNQDTGIFPLGLHTRMAESSTASPHSTARSGST